MYTFESYTDHFCLASNIFVHQKCKCTNTMLCVCTDTTDTVSYVVGDLDLLCFEGVRTGRKYEKWRMTHHDPAGTTAMKPLEVNVVNEVCRYIAS